MDLREFPVGNLEDCDYSHFSSLSLVRLCVSRRMFDNTYAGNTEVRLHCRNCIRNVVSGLASHELECGSARTLRCPCTLHVVRLWYVREHGILQQVTRVRACNIPRSGLMQSASVQDILASCLWFRSVSTCPYNQELAVHANSSTFFYPPRKDTGNILKILRILLQILIYFLISHTSCVNSNSFIYKAKLYPMQKFGRGPS